MLDKKVQRGMVIYQGDHMMTALEGGAVTIPASGIPDAYTFSKIINFLRCGCAVAQIISDSPINEEGQSNTETFFMALQEPKERFFFAWSAYGFRTICRVTRRDF